MKWQFLALLPASLALLGCAPTTRVTLLPQPDGIPTAVVVQSSSGQLKIDQAYAVAQLGHAQQLQAAHSTATQVQARHGQLMAAAPPEPQQFTLHFETGGTHFTAQSEANLNTVLDLATQRAGSDIVIVGHTDQTGGDEINDQLSLERARHVRELLIERGFDPNRIEAVGRGSREPLITQPDQANQPRNRRTEIFVR